MNRNLGLCYTICWKFRVSQINPFSYHYTLNKPLKNRKKVIINFRESRIENSHSNTKASLFYGNITIGIISGEWGSIIMLAGPTSPTYRGSTVFDHLTACVKFGHTPGKLWCPHAVTVDSNSNQIYVVEGLYLTEGFRNIARVSIFLETGEFLNTFSLQHMKEPYGIAIHRDNVYVTDIVEHSVFHFKVEASVSLVG